MPAQQVLTGILCFLLGSIPFGYLLGRLRGVDLRDHGSGNTGATNTARVLGKKIGFLTLLLDIGKGSLAVYLGSRLDLVHGDPTWASAAGVLALFGHCFSPFLHFKGGKGVATGLGVFLVLSPLSAWMAIGIFATSIKIGRYVSISSILAAATIPAVILTDPKGTPQILALSALLCSSLVILRHRANIRRLLEGTEPKWGQKKLEEAEAE